MSDAVMFLLTPLFVLVILALFRFTGCSSFSANTGSSEKKPVDPPVVTTPPDKPPPVAAPSYQDVVAATTGFAAFWPLDETGGNVASVVGSLNPAAQGVYTSKSGVPPGTGYRVGQDGVLFPKVPNEFAAEFDGTVAYVEVPFNAPLNPVKTVTGFTLELWIKPNPASPATTQVVISSHRFDAANNQQGYEIALVKDPAQTQHQIRARLYGNIPVATEAVVQPLQGDPAEWRHVLLIYEVQAGIGPTLTLVVKLAKSGNAFRNGPHSAAYVNVTSAKPSTLRFAAGHAATTQAAENFFAGRIDNVAFYNAVLPQSEIDKHFNMA